MTELTNKLHEQFAMADQLEATIRKNMPACRSRYGAGRRARCGEIH